MKFLPSLLLVIALTGTAIPGYAQGSGAEKIQSTTHSQVCGWTPFGYRCW